MAYGQATLTQRKFYRITGGSTQNKGVIPDIKLVDIYNEQFGERKAKNALKWDTIPTAPFKREGEIQPYVASLSKLSQQRVNANPQFQLLATRSRLAQEDIDKKQLSLDIDQRKAELLAIEKKSLDAENLRRTATGLKPFANWESYQAYLDAQGEARGKMKANQRPALPEEEAFVTEAANVLLDYAKVQATNK